MASRALTGTTAGTTDGISVSGVFGRSVDVLKANPVGTFGIGFVMIALPQLLLEQFGGRAGLFRGLGNDTYAVLGLYGFVVGLLWLIASGAIVHATVAHDEGRVSALAENLRIGLLRCLPLFVVNVLFVLAAWIGLLFLVIPGIMLAVMWSVSVPAIVAERVGIFGAFGRSRALTKGARWQVFGILLLALAIYILVSIVVGLMGVAGYGSFSALTGGTAQLPVSAPALWVQLLQSIVTTVILTWYTTVSAALFVELRHWKDGPLTDQLADIFA